ncbi:MAG TPA: radical SAM protein [Bryobacteraceae bacterium]|nr:radical SAM protein [Bryobacteraceae bacterium]
MAAALVGIAKLASESPVLEAKRRVQYFDLPTRRFIGRASGRKMPFEWTINPYRGCEFGCKYCYARYTHEFMELRETEQFEQQIYAKQFHPELFRAELRRVPRREGICIGSATDPYQPAERRFHITQRILEVFARDHGRTLSVTTKSDLVARDADLLRRIAEANTIHVFMTITTADDRLARILEPYAPRPELRLEAIRKLSSRGIGVVVLACPLMPLINDSLRNLEAVAVRAVAAGAQYMYGNPLFLKPCAQKAFFPMLDQHFPHLARKYRERYRESAFLKGSYPDMIRRRIEDVRNRYGLTSRPAEYLPDVPVEPEQLRLWK